jgi:hypothetical protein
MERRNREIKKDLRLRLGGGTHHEYNLYLPEIVFNTGRRRNAAPGQIPVELLLERNLASLGERPTINLADLLHRAEAARANQAAYVSAEPKEESHSLHVGDRNHPLLDAAYKWNAILAPQWIGSFQVFKRLALTFAIREGN